MFLSQIGIPYHTNQLGREVFFLLKHENSTNPFRNFLSASMILFELVAILFIFSVYLLLFSSSSSSTKFNSFIIFHFVYYSITFNLFTLNRQTNNVVCNYAVPNAPITSIRLREIVIEIASLPRIYDNHDNGKVSTFTPTPPFLEHHKLTIKSHTNLANMYLDMLDAILVHFQTTFQNDHILREKKVEFPK